MKELVENLAKLFKVKSIVTLLLTAGMLMLLSGVWKPSQEIISLYSMTYGACITYFFTRKDKDKESDK